MSFFLDPEKIALLIKQQKLLFSNPNYTGPRNPFEFPKRPQWENFINLFQIALIIITNSFFIALVLFSPNLRKISYGIMTSMAFGDMSVGILAIPTGYMAENLVVSYTYKTCLANYMPLVACPLISVLHFTVSISFINPFYFEKYYPVYNLKLLFHCYLIFQLISAEKFITIQYPLRYQQIVTKKAAIISCFIVWLISILVGFSPAVVLIAINKPSYEWFNYCSALFIFPDGYMLAAVLIFLLPTLTIVSVLYAKIIYVARQQNNKVFAEQTKQSSQAQRARVIRGMAIIVLVLLYFLVTYVPLAILVTVPNLDVSQHTWGAVKILAFSKAWIDPVMMCVGNKEIRNSVSKLLCRKKIIDDY